MRFIACAVVAALVVACTSQQPTACTESVATLTDTNATLTDEVSQTLGDVRLHRSEAQSLREQLEVCKAARREAEAAREALELQLQSIRQAAGGDSEGS